MKGDLTIKDAEYFGLLTQLVKEFEQNGMQYFIFGGGGVQIAIGSALTSGQKDFMKEPTLDAHLRRTADIDAFVNAPAEQLMPTLQELCYVLSRRHPNRPCGLQANSFTFGKAVVNYVNEPAGLKGFVNEVQRIFDTAVNSKLKKRQQGVWYCS